MWYIKWKLEIPRFRKINLNWRCCKLTSMVIYYRSMIFTSKNRNGKIFFFKYGHKIHPRIGNFMLIKSCFGTYVPKFTREKLFQHIQVALTSVLLGTSVKTGRGWERDLKISGRPIHAFFIIRMVNFSPSLNILNFFTKMSLKYS